MTHHIGETPPENPVRVQQRVVVGMMINIDAGSARCSAKYIFSGILDRHPKLRDLAGSRAGSPGCHGRCRTPSTCWRRYQHMFNHQARARHPVLPGHSHMSVLFMGRPAGPGVDRPDRCRQGDVVVGLPAQREHVRLLRRSRSHRLSKRSGPENAAKIVSGNIKKFLGV